jgi:Kae1-associated kinase Bud32|tara:strand:- start:1231 stop:1833 length:603 start_codon:yes stop_codon:yes gene_type:complete
MKLLAQGAEAKLYVDKKVLVKDRVPKSYRIKEIDNKLRKRRTKLEATILKKLAKTGVVPELFEADDYRLEMEFLKGDRVVDVFDKKYSKLCSEIGENIAILHNNHIIHGDLTTSNMILSKKVYFIDFGLSFQSFKVEDMAVDLHLLKQALESKHWKVWEKAYSLIEKSYLKKATSGSDVIKRIKKVEKRGRYKSKIVSSS